MKGRNSSDGVPGKGSRKGSRLKDNNKGINMSIKRIKELVDLMNENDLSEMEVEQEGFKVKLVKTRNMTAGEVSIIPQTSVQVPAGAGSAPSGEDQNKKRGKEVPSPMVGTFYRAASPESESYVNEGDVVQKGDVLCIIEAMKLMNEVKAEFGGRVIEILVENAESVEFGQALFLIEPI
ncbi:MAG: acetyl-CoA carboxylase biotin carboxyl carrier protein [Candidatus Omnitrophota bacterium]